MRVTAIVSAIAVLMLAAQQEAGAQQARSGAHAGVTASTSAPVVGRGCVPSASVYCRTRDDAVYAHFRVDQVTGLDRCAVIEMIGASATVKRAEVRLPMFSARTLEELQRELRRRVAVNMIFRFEDYRGYSWLIQPGEFADIRVQRCY